MPVAERYGAQGLCVRISAVPPPDDVFAEVRLRVANASAASQDNAAEPVWGVLTLSQGCACSLPPLLVLNRVLRACAPACRRGRTVRMSLL